MKTEHGRGSVKAIRNRSSVVTGYQALLPREMSEPPRDCKNPQNYQEPVGPPQPTREEARKLLDAAVFELVEKRALRHGLPLSFYADGAIKAKTNEGRRLYGNDARALKHASTWRSIRKLWLPLAPWCDWLPAEIDSADMQAWFDWLRDEAETQAGDPLSGSFIRQIASLVRDSFERAKLKLNPALGLKLPPKGKPRVAFLELAAQRRLFGAAEDQVDLESRTMVGCGMGGGLRIGELLAFEEAGARTEDRDPHLIVSYGGSGQAPTKGRETRRVELFEPALGFWRLWMSRFYRGGRMVFAGPAGGYQKHWPDQFPGWASVAGVEHLSSHIMRHTYAVSVLSGTWGYEPRSLEFVQKQLGHAERSTTERYYGAYEVGVWQRDVRRMTGREVASLGRVITASELLGIEGAVEVPPQDLPRKVAVGSNSRHPPHLAEVSIETAQVEAAWPQTIERGYSALRALADGEPTGVARVVDALIETLEALADLETTDARPSRGGAR